MAVAQQTELARIHQQTVASIAGLLKEITSHPTIQRAESKDWAELGDLRHVRGLLEEITLFLGPAK